MYYGNIGMGFNGLSSTRAALGVILLQWSPGNVAGL